MNIIANEHRNSVSQWSARTSRTANAADSFINDQPLSDISSISDTRSQKHASGAENNNTDIDDTSVEIDKGKI